MMTLNPVHLRELVVRPTLELLEWWSPAAEELCMGTVWQESVIGPTQYLKQWRGPALGIGQVEPLTHIDNWTNYLRFRDTDSGESNEAGDRMKQLVPEWAWMAGTKERSGDGRMEFVPSHQLLVVDMRYCIAHARLKYRRSPLPLPPADDPIALGEYWDRVYNANPDHGTATDFAAAYRRMRELEASLSE